MATPFQRIDPLLGIGSFAPEFWRLVADPLEPASFRQESTATPLTPPVIPPATTLAPPLDPSDPYAPGKLIIRVPPNDDPKMEPIPRPDGAEECLEPTDAALVRIQNHETDARRAVDLQRRLETAPDSEKAKIRNELDQTVARVRHGEPSYQRDKRYIERCRA